jgi:nucleoside-diphosphate-sugar epimerase
LPWQDVARGVFDTPGASDPWNYQQADLCDAGEVFSMVARFQPDAVVHIAAIPDIEHNAPHTIFTNNISATFNVVEACVQLGVKRLVNISSEQAVCKPPTTSVCKPPACCAVSLPAKHRRVLRTARLLLQPRSTGW